MLPEVISLLSTGELDGFECLYVLDKRRHFNKDLIRFLLLHRGFI